MASGQPNGSQMAAVGGTDSTCLPVSGTPRVKEPAAAGELAASSAAKRSQGKCFNMFLSCPEIVIRRSPSKIGVAKRSLSWECRKLREFGGDRLPDDPSVEVDRRLDMHRRIGLRLVRIEWRLRPK